MWLPRSPFVGTLLLSTHGLQGVMTPSTASPPAVLNPDCSTLYQKALAAQQNIRNLELSVKSVDEEMVQYSNGESELQDKMGELTDELEGKMTRVHTAKLDVKTAQASLAAKEAELQKATDALEAKEERLKDLTSFVSNVENKLKAVNSEGAHIGRMLQDARTKQKMVRDTVESKAETLQKAREVLVERRQALTATTKALNAHEAALRKLETETRDASELHKKAVAEEKELQAKRSELDGYTSEYQSKIEESKRRLDELDRQVDSAMLRNTTLGRVAMAIETRELKQAEERLHLVQQQLEAAKQEFNAKSGDIVRLTQARTILEEQRQNMTNSSSTEADRLVEQARREVAHAKTLLKASPARRRKTPPSKILELTGESFLQSRRLRHSKVEDTPDQTELRKFVKNPSKEVAAKMPEELIEKLDSEVDLALYRANTTVGMIESRVKSLVKEVADAEKDRSALMAKLKKAVDQSETAARILAELQKRNDISKKEEKNDTATYDHLTEQQAIFAEKYEGAHEAATDSRSKLQDASDRYEHAKVRQEQLLKKRTAAESAVKALMSSFEMMSKDKKRDEDMLRTVVYRQQRTAQGERSNEVRDAASRLNVEIAALSKAERSQKGSQAELEKVKLRLSKKQELLEASRKRKASMESRLEKTKEELGRLLQKSRSMQCPEMDIL
ncbi:hypothetical protein FOZ60_010384 [Perkinsus olseni]|uniref:Uncharacterized protein n=2 Tax=Perkinsus olseni TaxID=32597 RepID=A0A7J6NFJ4_PEROL|nr:hypothetical protein FOZ60_010384 [Perkinsus olseni]